MKSCGARHDFLLRSFAAFVETAMTNKRHGWRMAGAVLAPVGALALLGFAALPAHAQWLGADYANYGAPLNSFMQSSVLNNSSMIQAATPAPRDNQGHRSSGSATAGATSAAPAVSEVLTLRADAPPAVQRNAADLAAHFPPGHRAVMTKAFADSLDVWHQLETKLGLPATMSEALWPLSWSGTT